MIWTVSLSSLVAARRWSCQSFKSWKQKGLYTLIVDSTPTHRTSGPNGRSNSISNPCLSIETQPPAPVSRPFRFCGGSPVLSSCACAPGSLPTPFSPGSTLEVISSSSCLSSLVDQALCTRSDLLPRKSPPLWVLFPAATSSAFFLPPNFRLGLPS